jgi:hypothetical protein
LAESQVPFREQLPYPFGLNLWFQLICFVFLLAEAAGGRARPNAYGGIWEVVVD